MDRQESITNFEKYLKRRFPERRTPIDYVSDIQQFAAFCDKPWREVTMHDIDDFVDQQRQKHKQTTVQRRVAALKTFFDFLAEESGDLSWPNPVRFKRHGGKAPQTLPRDLSDEAVEQIWQAVDSPRDRAWFVLMWRAGLRVGEVVDLTLANILSPAGDGQAARLRIMGKGRKEREVLLSAEGYAILQEWLAVRPDSEKPYIFLNEKGKQLRANGILWLVHQYGQKVGIPFTPHQLRHTFARQMIEAGMPLATLSKLLGHADLDTTTIYTAGADPELNRLYQEAMSRLTRLPSPPPSEPSTETASPPAPAPISPAPTGALAIILAKRAQELFPETALQPRTPPPLPDWDNWATDLPDFIRQACLDQAQRLMVTARPSQQRQKAKGCLAKLKAFWEWQLARRELTNLADLHLADLQTYQSERAAKGLTANTINGTLTMVVSSLRFQFEAEVAIDPAIFRLRHLPIKRRLPRYIPEDDYRRLETYVKNRLDSFAPAIRLENACYFVLAHTGLRASECVYLEVGDLDLSSRQLIIRQGKGQKDRKVYLSETAALALTRYLGQTRRPAHAPLWVYPNGTPMQYNWLLKQMAALGEAAGLTDKVTPHRLRHSLATRLLNAGMDITRIQKLLGHTKLSSTQIYAHVLDATLEADYHQAMTQLERQSQPLSDKPIAVENWPVRPEIKFPASDEAEAGNLGQMAD